MIGVAADIWEEKASFVSREKFIAALVTTLGKEAQHKRSMGEAADIGTVVHNAIERKLLGEMGLSVPEVKKFSLNPEQKASARQAYEAFLEWKEKHKFRAIEIEKRLYSVKHRYAGTMDVLGEGNLENEFIYNDLAVGDWKTSVSIYLSACLQISAYREACIELGLHDLSIRKLNGLILRLPKNPDDPGFEARFIPQERMETYFVSFLAAKAVWHAVQEYEKEFPWRRKRAKKKEKLAA